MYYIKGVRKDISDVTNDVTRACFTCKYYYTKALHQQIGQLPEDRVTFFVSIYSTGVDFAEPFSIKLSRIRKLLVVHTYLRLFCY